MPTSSTNVSTRRRVWRTKAALPRLITHEPTCQPGGAMPAARDEQSSLGPLFEPPGIRSPALRVRGGRLRRQSARSGCRRVGGERAALHNRPPYGGVAAAHGIAGAAGLRRFRCERGPVPVRVASARGRWPACRPRRARWPLPRLCPGPISSTEPSGVSLSFVVTHATQRAPRDSVAILKSVLSVVMAASIVSQLPLVAPRM